ncbi:MAG: VIT1/CCC1 transporter family protein [Lentisphaeria bacterium]|nr:VIT1/CCC1 transporter family protein [Lentisphaeria bacterium]
MKRRLLGYQRNEITEHHIYRGLAAGAKDAANRAVLERIAADELGHYERWKSHSGEDVAPNRLRVFFYTLLARVLGFTFAIKLMEHGEEGAQGEYDDMAKTIAEAKEISADENRHEEELIAMLDEERLRYIGSIVLGLSDALVELTGALAGLTLALRNTRLIAFTGLITGIAAALSMAASEYLSTKSEAGNQHPVKAAVYTGLTYVFTVAALIGPYLLLDSYLAALGGAMGAALLIILAFNAYIAVAKDEPFLRRFAEMAGLTVGVSAFTFVLGYVIRALWGIEI